MSENERDFEDGISLGKALMDKADEERTARQVLLTSSMYVIARVISETDSAQWAMQLDEIKHSIIMMALRLQEARDKGDPSPW